MNKFSFNADISINLNLEVDMRTSDWKCIYAELEKMSTLASAFRIQDYYKNWGQLKQDLETLSISHFSRELQNKVKEAVRRHLSKNQGRLTAIFADEPEVKTVSAVHTIIRCNTGNNQKES